MGERWDPDKIKTLPRGKGLRVMVWAAIWATGTFNLYPLERDFESKKHGYSANSYIKILKDNIGVIWEPGALFQQDNAKIHSAKKTKKWFEDTAIPVLEWPPYSPDINPIEHMWALLKRKLYQLFPDIEDYRGTEDEIREHLFRCLWVAWEAIDEGIWRGLVKSMPRRIEAVIKAKGWHTKY